MADLTVGEIGKILQLNLVNVDQTQTPPVYNPLDLTNVATVDLLFVITDSQAKPKSPVTSKQMSILSPPTSGIVQYTFQAGDLVAPPEMGKYGVFRYSVQVNYTGGSVLYAVLDGQLSIKNDAEL